MSNVNAAQLRSLTRLFVICMLSGFAVALGFRAFHTTEEVGGHSPQPANASVPNSASLPPDAPSPINAESHSATPAIAQQPRAAASPNARSLAPDPATAPRAIITSVSRNGMAPFTLHVHALESTLGLGDCLNANFQWNFGDPASDFNELEGFNAAHVYDSPGEYTVTLTVTNHAGQSHTDRIPVRVDRARRRTIHVSLRGNDQNDGLTPDMPVRSASRAVQLMRDDTAILFQRGHVFPIRAGVELTHRNWVLSDFGEGPKPILQWTGEPGFSSIITMSDACESGIIENLRFNSNLPDFPDRNICDALAPAGRNITIRRCDFEHLSIAVNANRQPHGLLTVNNHATDLRAYFIWGEGADHVHLDNTVTGSTFEHNMRFAAVERVLLAHNTLTNSPKRCIWAMTGDFMYLTQNSMLDGGLAIGPNYAQGPAEERFRWCVASANTIRKPAASTPAVQIPAGAEHVMLRNNIIEAGGGTAIDIQGHHADFNRNVSDLRILHNTSINPLRHGRFIHATSGAEAILVLNNLYAAPAIETGEEQSAFMFILDDDLKSFTRISGNVWPVPARSHWVDDARHYLWPVWSDARGFRDAAQWRDLADTIDDQYIAVPLDADFRPLTPLPARPNASLANNVVSDRYSRLRPLDRPPTIGAVEFVPSRTGQ